MEESKSTGERDEDERAGAEDDRDASTPEGGESGPSDVDAMGQDKRRAVIGQGYGPSRARQFVFIGLVLALFVGAYFGLGYAVDKLDTAPAKAENKAPWSKPGVKQHPAQQFQ